MDIDIVELREDFGISRYDEAGAGDKRRAINKSIWRKNAPDFRRIAEMRRMRFIENKPLKEIGEIFGVSRERVRQLIGNTGRKILGEGYAHQMENINPEEICLKDAIEKTGISESVIRRAKRGARWKLEDTGTSRSKGARIEELVSAKLTQHGIENKLMPNSYKYDIETIGGKTVEVKASFTRMFPPSVLKKSPGFRGYFGFKTSRERHADFLILVIAEQDTREFFVIPAEDIKYDHIHLGWPMRENNGFIKYHNNFDIIAP